MILVTSLQGSRRLPKYLIPSQLSFCFMQTIMLSIRFISLWGYSSVGGRVHTSRTEDVGFDLLHLLGAGEIPFLKHWRQVRIDNT